jgi:hypothetical protein
MDIIDILDTPPKATPARSSTGEGATGGPSQGNVASIFASRKRVKLEDQSESKVAADTPGSGSSTNQDRKRPFTSTKTPGSRKDEVIEKKPRINPLVANQPYVHSRVAGLYRRG